jgi:alpha-glucosidase (family GH31 glycosyl hydrolase)
MPHDPVADPRAVITHRQARFTVLTPSIIRMEWSPTAQFEDRASYAVINRLLPVPRFEITRESNRLIEIETDNLVLTYVPDDRKFSRRNLTVRVKSMNDAVWRPGMRATGNLGGTTRTLDGVDGACDVEPGLISRDGWVLVDDSKEVVFDPEGPHDRWPWPASRKKSRSLDWYFLGHGHDYKRALREYTLLGGSIPLPPRYVFGAWWSRYWPYSERELRELVGEFDAHEAPLDVLVIDMDWHLPGWTGYTWDPRYFPDPEQFLKWADEQGLRTTLNLHPADGVGAHEAMFEAFARAMGRDPKRRRRIPFDCTDPAYVDAYFELLHHPIERQGLDFWWMDWQQGHRTKVAGLDPLPWLNHLHWVDWQQNPDRADERPLIFSRWGGLGNHRYPIGFSGDTFSTWESLAFQPSFTATAANVGYAYWSHDIGGHQPGPVDPEMYVRWIQYGVMSPVLRTHTSRHRRGERRIWAFEEPFFSVARDAFDLRYELLPYLYTAARQCYDDSLPFCRPLYYEWPDLDDAYEHTEAYCFGDDIVVTPVVTAADPLSRAALVQIWVPPGAWIDWFTGERFEGPATVERAVPLRRFPMLVRDGAILPLAPRGRKRSSDPVDPLVLRCFGDAEGSARLYEDDGTSRKYESGGAWTEITRETAGDHLTIRVGPRKGRYRGMRKTRRLRIELPDQWPPKRVRVAGEMIRRDGRGATWSYDAARMTLVIELPDAPAGHQQVIEVERRADSDGIRRFGLRSRLADLDEMATALGERAPDVIAELRAERGQMSRRPARAMKSAAVMLEAWPRLVENIAGVRDGDGTAASFLLQLLGINCRATVHAVKDDPGQFEIRATVARHREADPTLPVRSVLSIGPMKAFAPIDSPKRKSARMLPPGATIDIVRRLAARDVPKADLVETRFRIDAGDNRFSLAIHTPVFPSIDRWWVAGPFPCPYEEIFDRAFPPEERTDPRARYMTRVTEGGRKVRRAVRWRRVERSSFATLGPADEMFVDLQRHFGRHVDHAVAYALTYIEAPRATQGVLALGSDDGVVVRLNGEEIHRETHGRAYQSRSDLVPIRLRKGTNQLLLKVGQAVADWGFCAHLEDEQGRPLSGIRVHLNPPTQ